MTILTRRALYDLVWSKPVRTVADELNISDVGLRKVCVRADIPIPARGYWAKREAGKPVVQTALPPRPPGASDIAYGSTGRGYRWPPDPEAELAEPEPVAPVFEEPLEEVEARLRKAIGTVRYMRSLGDAHPQVKRVLQKDEDRARTYSWQTAKFDSPFEQRRFKLLSSLFFGVMRCGGKASLSGEAARSCHVSVGGQGVSFSLDHPKAKTDRWGAEHVHGGKTDVLKLQIQHMEDEPDRKCVWLDTDQESIEDQLTDITVALILAGEIRYRAGAMHSYRYALERREEMRVELARQRAEAERQERERLAKLEEERRQRLLGNARDWRDANDIRAFIAVVSESLRDKHPSQALDHWIAWANAVADRLDPLKQPVLLDVADA